MTNKCWQETTNKFMRQFGYTYSPKDKEYIEDYRLVFLRYEDHIVKEATQRIVERLIGYNHRLPQIAEMKFILDEVKEENREAEKPEPLPEYSNALAYFNRIWFNDICIPYMIAPKPLSNEECNKVSDAIIKWFQKRAEFLKKMDRDLLPNEHLFYEEMDFDYIFLMTRTWDKRISSRIKEYKEFIEEADNNLKNSKEDQERIPF